MDRTRTVEPLLTRKTPSLLYWLCVWVISIPALLPVKSVDAIQKSNLQVGRKNSPHQHGYLLRNSRFSSTRFARFRDAPMCGKWNHELARLYRKYQSSLVSLRTSMRKWSQSTGLYQGIGDLEAEILYIRIRENRPSVVAEFGFGQGMATMYMLHALRDNAHGELHTFELRPREDRVKQVDTTLASWKLHVGDARMKFVSVDLKPEYIHSDAEHSVDFAHWLIDILRSQPRIFKWSFHDVFVGNSTLYAKKSSHGVSDEGRVILNFVSRPTVLSVAQSHCRSNYERLLRVRQSLLLDSDWISKKESALNNPGIFVN